MIAPRLLAAKLALGNRMPKPRAAVLAALCIGALLALSRLARGAVSDAVLLLRPHSWLCLGVALFASAVAVARRRVANRQSFARSWLAAVPMSASAARLERWAIETLPATATLAVLSLSCLCIAATLPWNGAGPAALLVVWSCGAAGILSGAALSYLIPAPKTQYPPPGSRYVPQARPDRSAAIHASLQALGLWPIRQMFAWAQPKMVSRAILPILVMMPLGSTAATAMVVVAAFVLLGGFMLLWLATVSVSRRMRRWLAPLPLQLSRLRRALLVRPLAAMIAGSALCSVLLLACDVAFPAAAMTGVCLAAALLLVTVAAVLA